MNTSKTFYENLITFKKETLIKIILYLYDQIENGTYMSTSSKVLYDCIEFALNENYCCNGDIEDNFYEFAIESLDIEDFE